MKAKEILDAAGSHMQDRAKTYDAPDGERSIPGTVTAFNVLTGHQITNEQGWLFMELLKCARSQQGEYRADSYEDAVAFAALRGEQAAMDRGANLPTPDTGIFTTDINAGEINECRGEERRHRSRDY
jgi:hypothetical protein